MPFRETKVYFDGSHYIAIPHTRRPQRARKELVEEKITVVKELPEREQKESAPAYMDAPFPIITDKKEQKTEDKKNSKVVFEQADEH